MVAGFNKWCVVSVLPLFLMVNGRKPETRGGNLQTPAVAALHPLHLAVAEMEQNPAEQTLEISCRIFTDDFENILEKTYQANVDLINPPDRPAVQKLINDYIRKRLLIKADGKQLNISCIGFEKDHEATFSYFQAEAVPAFKKIEITNNLMYDLFDDQTNIMHVKVGGTRKSTKLNYPAKEAAIEF